MLQLSSNLPCTQPVSAPHLQIPLAFAQQRCAEKSCDAHAGAMSPASVSSAGQAAAVCSDSTKRHFRPRQHSARTLVAGRRHTRRSSSVPALELISGPAGDTGGVQHACHCASPGAAARSYKLGAATCRLGHAALSSCTHSASHEQLARGGQSLSFVVAAKHRHGVPWGSQRHQRSRCSGTQTRQTQQIHR